MIGLEMPHEIMGAVQALNQFFNKIKSYKDSLQFLESQENDKVKFFILGEPLSHFNITFF